MPDGDEIEFEEYDHEKHKAEMAERERVLEEAREKISALCHDFNRRHGEKAATIGGKSFRWQVGIYMIPIKEGDLGVLALNGKTKSLWKEFDLGAACDILNGAGCTGFHQGHGREVKLIGGKSGRGDGRRLVMRDGRPALIDERDSGKDSVWRDDGKSPWDCSTYVIEEVGKSKRIECIGGCMHNEVVKWPTMGFGGNDAVLGILREWMEPERRADSQRIRIMAVVHQFEEDHVLTGLIRKIEVGMKSVTMTIEADRMIPTGIHYG